MYLMLCKSRVPIRKGVMQLWTQKKNAPTAATVETDTKENLLTSL